MARRSRQPSNKQTKEPEEVHQDPHAEGQEEDVEPPTSIDPYEVLEVEQSATEDDIKKSYRKLALKFHPDKASEEARETAKQSFQRLAFAYAILSDPARRKRYDATGSTSDSVLDVEGDDFDWLAFYRSQYENVITADRIQQLKDEYKNSEQERKDILNAYRRYKGDMDKIYETVCLSSVLDDDGRFRNVIDTAIEEGAAQGYSKYSDESDKSKAARIKRAKNEAKAAEREKKKLDAKKRGAHGGPESNESELAALIASNQAKRGNIIDQIEAKYAEGGKRKRAKMDEPPEEAFAANRARTTKAKKVKA